jgi:sugar transferase (PEP-CTERM system associated)
MLKAFKQYYPTHNIFFVIGESVIIYGSVLLVSCMFIKLGSTSFNQWLLLKIFFITFVCQAFLYYHDLYELTFTESFFELGIRLLQAIGASAIFLAGIYFVFPEIIIGHYIFIISVGFMIVLIVSWRFCYKIALNCNLFNQKIIVVGSGELAKVIINEINQKKDCGYTVSVIIPECSENINFPNKKDAASTIYKKDFEDLCVLSEQLGITKVVIALTEKRGLLPIRELLKCRVSGIEIIDGVSFYEKLKGKLMVEQINPAWLIFSEGFQKSQAMRFLKRTADINLSIILTILLLPIFVITAILIKIDSKGPIIFSQERIGKNRNQYLVYKFRSMLSDAEKQTGPVWTQDNDARITRVGRVIRKLRIDEIPQLWNVLKGDMSFVGPRPEREFFVKKLEDLIPYYGERFTVKPGITGWAQVSYGYGASVEDAVEKLCYDLFYIKNMSIFMDLLIILRTIKIVLFAKGAR